MNVDEICDRAFVTLLGGPGAALGHLGAIAVREYAAYEGRNPRTGEAVSVPKKRLPFLRVSDAATGQANGGVAIDEPLGGELARAIRGEPVVLGALGVMYVRHKPGRVGRDPQTYAEVVIPAQSMITFRASKTLKSALHGERPSEVLAGELEPWFARPMSIEPPKSLAKTVATLRAVHALEKYERKEAQEAHERYCEENALKSGDVFAATDAEDDYWAVASREADALVWHTRGPRDTGVRVSRWLAAVQAIDALVDLAGDRVIAPAQMRRVLARLEEIAPGVARTIDELPY
jgi:nucleoid DNA-binding protein